MMEDTVPTGGASLTSLAAWSDASSYAVADVTMLRRELVIGYVVAGLLAVNVPAGAWNAMFVHGHGTWTSVENALVGPLIAVASWVCSIGNVPLAAALWAGGISFGGVIAFIFADLIAMPLILVYRKLYGAKLAWRMVGLFYVIMALAGLLTEWIFRGLGAVPARRSFHVPAAHFEWNYTTYLNVVFIGVAASVWWLARHRERFGGGQGYAIDPVCGMQVSTATAPARAMHAGQEHYFCSDRCRERFGAKPGRYVGETELAHPMAHTDEPASAIDPVCGMRVDPEHAAAKRSHGSQDYWFCGTGCAARFDEDPERFLAPGAATEGMPTWPAPITLGRKPEHHVEATDDNTGANSGP